MQIKKNVPSGVWNLGKLNHLAVAVPDLGNEAIHEYGIGGGGHVAPLFILDEASSFFKNVLQAKSVSGATPLKEHGVYTVFVDLGNTKIEVSRLDMGRIEHKD